MAAAYQLYAVYLWAALIALFIVLVIWVITLQVRMNRLISHYDRLIDGADGGTLEDALNRYIDRLDEATTRVQTVDQVCRAMERQVQHAIQRTGVVRFNPFADTGGDQSFAVALLDENGSGLVVSSLFSRASTRIFAKEIIDGKSTHVLTEEENQAIERAMRPTPEPVTRKSR